MTSPSPKKQPIPFGRYLLLDRINIGGMAEVWRGKVFGAGGFERLVAIKRIRPNIAEDEEFISMFQDEAKISVQLTHANICQIYELNRIGPSLYIAMEYVPGKDLRSIFERARKKGEPPPVPLVCYVIGKLCEGLDYAHRKKDQHGRDLNVVHRDVSPQNVLISFEGEVKVIDFGIAKAAGKVTKTQAGILTGKFGYMSPEQSRGLPLDRRSDVVAIARDAGYARAHAGLADAYVLMSNYGFGAAVDLIPKARSAARRALALDETLAEAHPSLALMSMSYDRDWRTADQEFVRAAQLNPNYATTHHWYAEMLAFQGRFGEAEAASARSRELDPLSLIIAADHGAILYFSRNYAAAIDELRAVLAAQRVRMGFQRTADLQLLPRDARLAQLAQQLLRYPCRQVDEAVIVANHHAADVLAVDAGFIGDRADDVAGLHAVYAADLDAVGFHRGVFRDTVPRLRSRLR